MSFFKKCQVKQVCVSVCVRACVCVYNTWSVGPLSCLEWLISPQLCCLSVSCCAFDPFHTVIMLNSGNVPTLFSWNTSLCLPAGTRRQKWLNSVVFSKITENFAAIYADKHQCWKRFTQKVFWESSSALHEFPFHGHNLKYNTLYIMS